jgi:uncharacterized protein YnzC (UPF0291/DUF896 family)
MSNPNSIVSNKENIAREVLASAEIQAAIQQDLESINQSLANPVILESLEQTFGGDTNEGTLDCSKLTPEQIEKIQAIEFLLSGQKSDSKSIIANAKSADRQPWMSRHDSDSLDSPWYVTPNNVIQMALTTPALSAAAIAMMGTPANIALGGGFVASLAAYTGLDIYTHKMDRTPLPSDSKLRSKAINGRIAVATAGAAVSAAFSVAGGLLIPATFNNPQFKVEAEMVKLEKIEKSIETTTNAVESAKAALAESNPNYKSLVAKRDELSGRLTKETDGIKEIEKKLAAGGLSPTQIKELKVQRQNYLSHTGTGKFSNQPQLDDYNKRIEIIEKTSPALEKAKFGLTRINDLKANIPGAWEKSKDGKLKNLDALQILAVDQGIAAEAVQPISEGNLSSVQMEKIAKDSLEDMADLTSKGLTGLALGLEALVLLGRIGNYNNKRKQMLLTEDFQDGQKQIGNGFIEGFKKLMTPPNLPADRSQWTKMESRAYMIHTKNQEIIGRVFKSKEFALAVQIMAAKKQNNLGLAMNQFEAEYSANSDERSSVDKNQKKVAKFEQSFQDAMVANDIHTIRENLRRGINRAGIFKASENPNLVGQSKMAEATDSVKRAATNVKRFVTNPFNNLKNGQNKEEIMKAEILPANSILSILESLRDAKIKEALQVKIGQMLLRHLKSNPGTNYTKAKVIEIANLPASNLNDEEKQTIGNSLEEMHFGEHKNKVRDIKSKFVEELNKTRGINRFDKANDKIMSELAKTINQLDRSIDMNNTDSTVVSYRNNLNIIATTNFVALGNDEAKFNDGIMNLIARVNDNYDKPFDIKTDPLYEGILAAGGDANDFILKKVLTTKVPTQLPPQTNPNTPTNP